MAAVAQKLIRAECRALLKVIFDVVGHVPFKSKDLPFDHHPEIRGWSRGKREARLNRLVKSRRLRRLTRYQWQLPETKPVRMSDAAQAFIKEATATPYVPVGPPPDTYEVRVELNRVGCFDGPFTFVTTGPRSLADAAREYEVLRKQVRPR